jgi:hypothetical protein
MFSPNGMTLKALVEAPEAVPEEWLNEPMFKTMALALMVLLRGRHAARLTPCPFDMENIHMSMVPGLQACLLKADAWLKKECGISASVAHHPPEYRRSFPTVGTWTHADYQRMDVWAAGSVLYKIATGEDVPDDGSLHWNTRFPFSVEGRFCIASMLNPLPEERPVPEILMLENAWLSSDLPTRSAPPASEAAKALCRAPASSFASGFTPIQKPTAPVSPSTHSRISPFATAFANASAAADDRAPLLPAVSMSIKGLWRPT